MKAFFNVYKSQGVYGLVSAIRRFIFPIRAKCMHNCLTHVKDLKGIEIGGPSGVFSRRGLLPLYQELQSLDNCNFSTLTTWEGSIEEGNTFRFAANKPLGKQYVKEATNLDCIGDEFYDFLLSSHVIEHSANAIKVLEEWIRIVKKGGVFVLIFPHKDGTFDHLRPVTTLEHLISDYKVDMKEDDLTHLSEILRLHDLQLDPEAGTPEQFRQRSGKNFENRCMHHHVFDTTMVAKLLDYVGVEIMIIEAQRPNHIIAVARKPLDGLPANNRTMLSELPSALMNSPFPSDHNAISSDNLSEKLP